MSFTYSLGTNVGKVRLWIQDTNSASYSFSDEEIDAILSQYGGDIRATSAAMLLILASNKAKLAMYKSAGKYTEDLRSIAKELREQAKSILETSEAPYETVAEQTFGPLDKPFEGAGEQEFIERESLRGES